MSHLLRDACVAAVTGTFVHVTIFNRGEHHVHGAEIIAYHCYAVPAVYGLLVLRSYLQAKEDGALFSYYDAIDPSVLFASIFLGISYLVGLFGSIAVYRLTFHPLRKFPGPFKYRLSKLAHFLDMIPKRQNHLLMDDLHRRYGTHVRTGPDEITIFDPEVFLAISGPKTTCIKSPWYDLMLPQVGVVSVRDPTTFRPRRRVWDEAFKYVSETSADTACARRYAASLTDRLGELVRHGDGNEGALVDVTDWCHRFSYNVAGEMAFGRNLNLINGDGSSEEENVAKIISGSMILFGFISPVPWLGLIVKRIAALGPTSSWDKAMNWCQEAMKERRRLADEAESEKGARQGKDLSSFIIRSAQQEQKRQQQQGKKAGQGGSDINLDNLYGDSFSVMLGGGDTTGSTLTFLFWELARNSAVQQKLYEELMNSGLANIDSDEFASALPRLPYLNGCMEETLRLHPVVPTLGIRMTQETGVAIAGKWIPPYTTIVAPRHQIGRLEACFAKPLSFVPERWTDKPEMVMDRRAHNPFNIGRHVCPGRAMGRMQMAVVIASVIRRFELSLPSNTTANLAELDGLMKDNYSNEPPKLDVVFRLRA